MREKLLESVREKLFSSVKILEKLCVKTVSLREKSKKTPKNSFTNTFFSRKKKQWYNLVSYQGTGKALDQRPTTETDRQTDKDRQTKRVLRKT